MSSVCRSELEACRCAPVFLPIQFYTRGTHESEFETADLPQMLSQTTQKHSFTLSTMSKQNQTTMIWDARGTQPINNPFKRDNGTRLPTVVDTVTSSSSQSQLSSIGIGEFGMNPAQKGNAAAFSMAIKDDLFPKVKFLQGTNANLDFSKDKTSICGFLQSCCGVSDDHAYQWWEDHRTMVKNIHTDCRNNKIKMIKQQFNGKLL